MSVNRRRRGHPYGFGIAGAPTPPTPPGPSEVAVPAVNFDGTNDYLTRAAFVGAAAGKELSLSLWIKSDDDGTPAKTLIGGFDAGAGGKINPLALSTSNKIEITLVTSAGGAVWLATSGGTITVADGWTNVLISVNSATGARSIYIDDVADTFVDTVFVADALIDWLTRTTQTIGADSGGLNKFVGDMAEFWLDDHFIDFTVEANRRKFISAGGKPVDLGANGEDPLGAAPLTYLHNATATWQNNLGTGGNFTEVGALTDAATSPSD